MGKYRLFIKPSARKELLVLPKEIKSKAEIIIDSLPEHPRPYGVKKLVGYSNYYRIRIGNYRIVYVIDENEKLVRVMIVKHRKEAYK